jgi:hypothetical protein
MPSTIRDLTELTTVAVDDYLLISDTSDTSNRDKRISTANLQLALPKKSGTPVAGRVAGWLDANTLNDGGFAISDIARLSVAQTFINQPTFSSGAIFTLNLGMAAHMGLQGAVETLADQTAVLINNLGNNGVIILSSSNRTGVSALICFRANSSPFCQILGQPSANLVETTLVVLNGTTGTNGKATFSATASPAQCYLENRLGASLSYYIVKLT